MLKEKLQKLCNYKENEYITKIFMIFLLIQPILDLYILFTDETIAIFKFSPATIIRMAVIAILFIIIICKNKKKKEFISWVLFGVVVLIYVAIHIFNCLNINENINSNYRVSIISEIFYIIRMILPLIIIYISFNIKMNFEKLSKVIIGVVLIFSIVTVGTHLLKISLKSYSDGDIKITQNLIDWIFNSEEVVDMSESLSKGWFRGGNQLGNLLIMLLPITILILFKKPTLLNAITIFLQVLTCVIIGTRVSSFSWIIIMFAMLILLFFFSKIKKEIKVNKLVFIYLAIIIVANGLLLTKSPTINRKYAEDYIDIIEQNKQEHNSYEKLAELNENKNSITNEEREYFIENNYTQFDIPYAFAFDIYNYKYDPQFWIDVCNKPYEEYNNSRKLQFLIADRIFELNNNPLDKLFGIGFTTTRNGSLYTELDYKAHYYTIGIVGSLLTIYPEIILLGIIGIIMLIKFKEKFTFENITYCMSLAIIFGIAFISAHVLDELVVTIFIGFIMGKLLSNIFKKENTIE